MNALEIAEQQGYHPFEESMEVSNDSSPVLMEIQLTVSFKRNVDHILMNHGKVIILSLKSSSLISFSAIPPSIKIFLSNRFAPNFN